MPTTQWAGPETPRARGQRRELDNELHSIPHLVSTADNELSGRGRRARLYFFFLSLIWPDVYRVGAGDPFSN